MNEHPASASFSRRDFLKWGGAAAGALAVSIDLPGPRPAPAQTPKRGGIFRIRLHVNPVHFDPQQTLAFSTMVPLSFTYSRLVKVKAGSAVKSGTAPLEPDLAESWTRDNDTTYTFKLRKGVRWHPKPPVNGRELTAEDIKYTYERFLTIKGNPNRGMLEEVDKVEALDKYTVRFTLKEPNAWFLDKLASTSTWVIAKEAVEQFGDLKKPEAVVGTGPWMLERYDPNVRLTFVRNPHYFVPGLPYADGVDLTLDADPASAFAAWLAGKYDFAPEYGMVLRRLDFEVARKRKPGLQFVEHIPVFGGITWMKLQKEPFNDVRVRRAVARASNWREVVEAGAWSQGHGVPNPAIPAAMAEWSIPLDQLPLEGRQLYEQDIADAKRLLAQAGHPNGIKTPIETTAGYGPDYMDAVQITLKNWKKAGIEGELKLKEYGAFVSSTIFGKFEKLAVGLFGAWADPDSYLYRLYMPGQITNAGDVNDPKLIEMIQLQRRTFDVAKRRELIYEIQRYLSQQVYYVYGSTPKPLVAWEPYVKNFGPNFGHDYGGRLMVAWLDR
ncbi:MAG: ABC transporter substrate-binding protein [Candidatus Rokubacteria bacterium]|nr:ABC transporter substrate-binding protein [Candidatus Rokubacteria bacterium]